jgi:hypothetical protein
VSKQFYLFLLVVLLSICSLSAQAVWENEVVARQQYMVDWNNSVVTTPDGASLILWAKGSYGNQGLYVHKIDNMGNALWEQDLEIGNDGLLKWFPVITTAGDGNFFIRYEETLPEVGAALTLAKITSEGEFCWQPHTIVVGQGSIHTSVISHDNAGGLYVIYGKAEPDAQTNLYLQHISATGQILIPGDGMQLTSDTRQEDAVSVTLTSDGGLLIVYNIVEGGIQYVRIIRLTQALQLAWANPLIINFSLPNFTLCSLVTTDATQFVLTWSGWDASGSVLYMQKIDLDGNLLYGTGIQIASHPGSSSLYSNTGIDAQGDLYISVHKGSNLPPMTNYLLKYSYTGVPLWGAGVALPDSLTAIFTPIPDNQGGCYILQKSAENYDNSYYNFAFQHIDATGQTMWENNGIPIQSHIPYEHHFKVAYLYTDRFYFYWVKQNDTNNGLNCQIRDNDGQLLSAPRIIISEGLSGNTTLKGIIARADDVLVWWDDERAWNTTHNWSQWYYQIIDADGNMAMPANGALLLDNLTGMYQNPRAVYLPNGNTVIIWARYIGSNSYILGQCIDNAGNLLWEPEGRTFATTPGTYSYSALKATTMNNDIYLTWSQVMGSDYVTKIQKVTDGQALWGNEGILISTGQNVTVRDEIPILYKDGYLVIKGSSNNSSPVYLWITHLEADGSLSPDWSAEGITVVSYPYNNNSQLNVHATIMDDNLYLINYFADPWAAHYVYSVYSPEGEAIVNQAPLTADAMPQTAITSDNSDGLAFCIKQFDEVNFQSRFGYSKLSSPLEYPWGNALITLLDMPGGLDNNTPGISAFTTGGYAIHWLVGDTIKGSFVNSDGENQTPLGGTDIMSFCNQIYRTAGLDGELYLAWNDYKVAHFSYYDNEIRLQKFANPTLGNPDEHSEATPSLLTCYPNPFHHQMQISFSLPEKSKGNLRIYNLKGQKVRSIAEGNLEKGKQSYSWDGKDNQGKDAASGVYYLKLESKHVQAVKKISYIK